MRSIIAVQISNRLATGWLSVDRHAQNPRSKIANGVPSIKFSKLAIFACLILTCSNTISSAFGEEVTLFDGETLQGWTTLDGKPITTGWRVESGMIWLDPSQGRNGHIVTIREFGDFELSFEWKIARGGNSGLKYRVRTFAGKLYGCEYQILDDRGYRKNFPPQQSAGALYDLYEPNSAKRRMPAGKFNSSRIVVHNNKLQHWLNDRLVVTATIGDEDWKKRVAMSKFTDLKEFGENRNGRIMLTDHGSQVWFRNFKMELLHGNGEPTDNVTSAPTNRTD